MLNVPETLRRSEHFRPLLALCDEVLLTGKDVATHWRQHAGSIANKRRLKTSPPFVKLGGAGAIRYRLSEILAWEIDGQGGGLSQERIALAIASFPGIEPRLAAALASHVRRVTEGPL